MNPYEHDDTLICDECDDVIEVDAAREQRPDRFRYGRLVWLHEACARGRDQMADDWREAWPPRAS